MQKKKRLFLLDEIRGLAVIAMVIYHAFYSMTFIFNIEAVYPIMYAIMPYEPIIPITFITISGIVSAYSKSNLKRGIIIFSIALIITLATCIVIPEQAILFGILHFLGIGLIIYSLLKERFDKVPIHIGFIISLILFIVSYNIPRGVIGFIPYPNIDIPKQLYSVYALSFLGFPSEDFVSSDYFPIIPNLFLLFAGTFIGRYLKEIKTPELLYKKLCPPLDFIGKHALIIYVVHQPLIIGTLYLITML